MASLGMDGWPNGAGVNSSIAATNKGVAGSDVPAVGVIFHNPTGNGAVTITFATAATNAGGIGLVAGESSQLLPCPTGNLTGWKAWAGSGTITVNALAFN